MQEAPDDIQFFIPYILKWMWLSVASLLKSENITDALLSFVAHLATSYLVSELS